MKLILFVGFGHFFGLGGTGLLSEMVFGPLLSIHPSRAGVGLSLFGVGVGRDGCGLGGWRLLSVISIAPFFGTTELAHIVRVG
ncbi:hypothetical protein [Pseudomonas sp. GD03944]|uniref:hypothetical protein n=1 Tax=Pseudomonas sp. GD03944 TaxID=2975409 RepID=UPI00244B33D9|nr:hypothetical protein [Pseudomonas sp. GD03944]MDH1261580.1 hypothetical protein [Pseudomonas sp. GD03944]